MTEKAPNVEQHHGPLSAEAAKQHQEKLNEIREKAESAHHEAAEKMPEIQHQAKEEAISGQEFSVAEKTGEDSQPNQQNVNRELKQVAYDRIRSRIRKGLSKPNQALDSIVHQPVVDKVSQISEQTIARPSGILGGSICAFVGSSALLWASKHYGFRYNYLVFFLFFVGGFALGFVLEMVWHLFHRNKQQA